MVIDRIPLCFVFLTILAFISIECKESPTESTDNPNLLLNESFETDRTPTLEGWRFGNPQLAQLVSDAPPDGGNWSLQLTADWAPTMGYAYRPITDVKSGDVVKLSAFVRAVTTPGGRAIIGLATGQKPQANHTKSAASIDTVWQKISVTDTLKLEPGDTLWVILSSPVTEIVPFRQEFDLVQLKKITKWKNNFWLHQQSFGSHVSCHFEEERREIYCL